MFYEFDGGCREIDFDDVSSEKMTMGIITADELEQYNKKLNFSELTVSQCVENSTSFHNIIDVYDDYSFGVFNIIDIKHISGRRDRLAFYVKKNFFLLVDVIDSDKSTLNAVTKIAHKFKDQKATMEKLIFSVLRELLEGGFDGVEKLQGRINSYEEMIADGKTDKEFNRKLLLIKKELTLLQSYYEQLEYIGNELRDDANDLFKDDNLFYFKLFTDRVKRLKENVIMMREGVVQLREAYDSAMDINLNNTMRFFTVLATVFMPLTLIVGWYGMNFKHMPELSWKYGYIAVIAVSVVVVLLSTAIFKRKKFF